MLYLWSFLLLATAVRGASIPSLRRHTNSQIRDTRPSDVDAAWNAAYTEASLLVKVLSNHEKSNVTLGQASGLLDEIKPTLGCTGTSGGVSRVRYPGLCLQDGPAGVRNADMVSAYPSGIHLGSSWNHELVNKIGRYMGAEFKKKGANVALGPALGPIGRTVLGGRNWEGYGADPYLSGRLGIGMVTGLQQNVMSCIKHLIVNEQETDRTSELLGFQPAVSENVDEKTLHEVYMWPFQEAVRAGASAVMCAYNRVNGTYACDNNNTMNNIIKSEFGFKGFVVSDWMAHTSGVQSAVAGMDMVMPDAGTWKSNALVTAVSSGTLTQKRLDDMTTRILAAWYKHKMNAPDWPALGVGLPASLTAAHKLVDARDPASRKTIMQAAVEGHVLVKNTNNVLPLIRPRLLSLFGFDLAAPPLSNPTGLSLSRWSYGLNSLAPSDLSLATTFVTGLGGFPQTATKGTLISGGGSGSTTGPYVSSPLSAFEERAYEDGTYLHWDTVSTNPDVNPASDACIVFINEFSIEAFDRTSLANTDADQLVLNVAAKCNNTIVVIHNAGTRLVDKWIDHPNVKAVIFAHLPGQDSGRALVEVMYGLQSPSGRLPYTVARRESDYGALLRPARHQQSDFSEGGYIDYRHFIRNKIQPRYPFGYGLSYTTFAYSQLNIVAPSTAPSNRSLAEYPPPLAPGTPTPSGGHPALFEILATVAVKVTNVGKFAAAEVAQLYIDMPGSEARQLRGFDKKMIGAEGAIESFRFELTRRDLSVYDAATKQWRLQKGEYRVYVGGNAMEAKLQGSFRI